MKPLNTWSFLEGITFIKSVDKKKWMIVLSSVAAFVLVIILLVIPAWISRPLLRREIQSTEAQVRQVYALSQKQQVWKEDQRIFGSLIEETQKRFFSEESLGVLLGQISKMANESHVDVLTSKPLTEKAAFAAPYNSKYQPSGYELTVQGGYHDLGAFVSRIETHERLLRIQSIEIMPEKKTPDRHIATLKIWAIQKALPQVALPVKTKTKVKSVKK